MAEFFPPVLFEIKAKATEAIATFGEVNKELAKMEKNGVLASGALGKMERASKLAGTAILGLGGAFAIFGIASVETLDKVEKSQANLEVAVKNTGVSFEEAKPSIDAHAKSMMALGFTYNDTYGALAKMTAASGSPQMALDSLGVAADLARFKQISLADAGTLVARASIGQAKGLGDLGLALGKTIPKGASFAEILKAIESRAGGAAYQFKNTLSGSIQVANANFQALQVEVGTFLVPKLITLTDWITNTGIPKLKNLFDLIKNNTGLFTTLGVVLAGVWATSKILSFIKVIKELVTVYRTLAASAAVAAVAEALATGGANLGLGAAAIAGSAAILGAAGISYLAYKATNPANTTPVPTISSMGNPNPFALGTPNLTGRGVSRYDTTTKIKKSAGGYNKAAKTGSVTITNIINNPNPSAVAAQVTKQANLGVTKGK